MITARATATFGPVGRSVAAARAFVRDTLHGWGLGELTDDAVVLTSELVTNAVVHAGTAAEVLCLRLADGIRIEVSDLYPKRRLELPAGPGGMDDPEREGGRGLLLCSTLATRWGVEYTPSRKQVWFLLEQPERAAAGRTGPPLPVDRLPEAEEVRVAVVQLDADGAVTGWNADAELLFGHSAKDVTGRPAASLVAWPQAPGLALTLDEALRLSRWEGAYGVRGADGRVQQVYASHLRVRDAEGRPSTVALLVRESDRAVLAGAGGRPAAEVPPARRPEPKQEPGAPDAGAFLGGPAPEDLDGLLQRTVERARDALDADSAYILLATDDETELEVRATTGLPGSRQRFARVPVETGTLRYGNTRMPAVHEDLAEAPGAVPMLTGSGMRALVTVPLKVEGRLTGSLGVASETPGRYTNDDAMRLQFAADRVALAIESTRLTELDRLRRDSQSFLLEASDLLAGTLQRDQTLALMAQMTVPTLASWCAVYTLGEQSAEAVLEYVLHEDEDCIDGLRALLDRVGPPTPDPVPGPRVWTAPAQEARRLADRYGADSTVVSAVTAEAVAGETVVLPLLARNRVIGLLALGKASDERIRREILDLADDLSRRAALALDNSRLYSERTAISQSLQRSLLPPELPELPGIEVEVIYRAAGSGNEVGGDFYDVFEISPGRWGFAIGDVCGTGPEAAAVTGLARHALRLLAREGLSGPQVLERLNTAILDEGSRSRFLTLLYGELERLPDGSAEMKAVCAGHPLPLLLKPDGRVSSAAHPQPLLGVMDELDLHEETVMLAPGDVLLAVTDGVTERREGTRMLGDDGLERVLAGCPGMSAGAVAARVERAVERFAPDPPSDDMAILVLRLSDRQD